MTLAQPRRSCAVAIEQTQDSARVSVTSVPNGDLAISFELARGLTRVTQSKSPAKNAALVAVQNLAHDSIPARAQAIQVVSSSGESSGPPALLGVSLWEQGAYGGTWQTCVGLRSVDAPRPVPTAGTYLIKAIEFLNGSYEGTTEDSGHWACETDLALVGSSPLSLTIRYSDQLTSDMEFHLSEAMPQSGVRMVGDTLYFGYFDQVLGNVTIRIRRGSSIGVSYQGESHVCGNLRRKRG